MVGAFGKFTSILLFEEKKLFCYRVNNVVPSLYTCNLSGKGSIENSSCSSSYFLVLLTLNILIFVKAISLVEP